MTQHFYGRTLSIQYFRERIRRHEIEERYSGIIQVECEIRNLKNQRTELERKLYNSQVTFKAEQQRLKELKQEVSVYDEKLAFASLGVYEPHFDYKDSETYRDKIKSIRDRQKDTIKKNDAVKCPKDITIDGSSSKGSMMIKRQVRLTLRAFNNECEAAIANVRWNNVNAMVKRIENAATQINKLRACP